ncbi:MAG: rod shape-determining protein RodA [Candidatus Magasanikbacteria bacterium]|nr:rod shape-determining protein RodA [Candidatus Magasanikbacteria bacterium]
MRLTSRQLFLWRSFDWVILALVLVLTAISLAAIYSIDLSRGDVLNFFPTQALAVAVGLVLFFTAGFFHISFYRASAKLVYLFSLLLLIAVLFFGQSLRGTTGWFRLGSFSFQPAEFAKVGLAIFLAWWISIQARRFDRWQFLLTSGFFTLLPIGLIMFQPDLGSAMVLFSVWFGLLFLVGVKKRYIALLVALSSITAVASWFFLFQDYQKDRLLTFLDPSREPLKAGYNVNQSVIAIGAGQIFGRGLGFGSQSQLHFLPEAQTDFIFSVIAEELGFLGVSVVLVIYFLLLWRLLYIAKTSRDDFLSYLVLGILLVFFVQILVNIGGAVGLLPVTGVTLPFLSYGGSSLVMNFLLLGVVESVYRCRVANS